MTWDELLNMNIESKYNAQVRTDIQCPQCGRYIYLDNTIILTSFPAKYRYWCSCGWTDCAHVAWAPNTDAFKGATEILAQTQRMRGYERVVYCGECAHMMPDGRCREFADDNIRPSASDYCSAGEKRADMKEGQDES